MSRFGSIKAASVGLGAFGGLLLLSACGGGDGTPPDETAGTAGMAAGTTGSGGTDAGAGGSGASSGSAGTAPCSMATPVSGGTIAPLETDGDRLDGNTYGGWFFFHPGESDGCPSCTTNPMPGSPPTVVLEEPDPPRAGTTKAMHWSGSDFEPMTYGAGMGMYLDNCASVPPAVTGVSFFYRSDSPLKFVSPQAGVDHGVDLPTAEDWTEHEVPFADLVPAGFDQTRIETLVWRVPGPENGTFSVWLDDVRWIGGSAP